ncbi:hypothetical protein PVAP13_7KG254455 [Panicum virgatum]|uniref:Uncharacterized protein n=1 Tax=Panicum virgatum TaxID=38727 RepID=A0A8T0QIF7_PANVG|nr:hypothetical protein PVAP13_7KG254455 [Panicum virgatum]
MSHPPHAVAPPSRPRRFRFPWLRRRPWTQMKMQSFANLL